MVPNPQTPPFHGRGRGRVGLRRRRLEVSRSFAQVKELGEIFQGEGQRLFTENQETVVEAPVFGQL